MRVNADELRSAGLEILGSQSIGRVGVGGDLVVQSVRLTEPGDFTSVRPENVPSTSGSLWSNVPVAGGFVFAPALRWTGSQYCQDPDTGSDVRLDGGTWIEAAISRVWRAGDGRRVETTASVDNLGDTALYDQCGLPRPGRLLRISVRVF